MSVLDRKALEQSPLADLHAIASELSIDSYRLLRRDQLVEAILARQDGTDGRAARVGEAVDQPEPAPPKPRRRRTRKEAPAETEAVDQPEPAPPKPRRRRTRNEAPVRTEPEAAPDATPPAEPQATEAVTDAASDRARFEALPARFPDEPLPLSSDDPTVAAIASLTPIGKGSRVTIVGPARAGKTETLQRLARALQTDGDLRPLLLLVGVRPEEITEWQAAALEPVQALSFVAPTSAQDRAVYAVIDEVRSIALQGGDAVILLDTLDGLHEHVARRVLATARRLVDGGSVTVMATASEPLGGETTVVALDPALTGAGRFPALDLRSSGAIRPELLVGAKGAQKIARARAKAAAS